jgi:hypothetical protein
LLNNWLQRATYDIWTGPEIIIHLRFSTPGAHMTPVMHGCSH